MRTLSWTKFQDFYLRLGFLRALAAVLDPQRRSTAHEVLVRRLEDLLFRPLLPHEALAQEVLQKAPWLADSIGTLTRVEALLISSDAESLLYAITKPTAYKILDWARDVDFIGAGNQITESGLLLRALLPREAPASAAGGAAWNPFVLTRIERAFFLFHLAQIDDVTMRTLDKIGALGASSEVSTADAAQIVARSLSEYVDAVKNETSLIAMADLRKARQLAETIANEVRLKPPDVRKRPVGRGGLPRSPSSRATKKNADHQTIPRFEQLVDLGFLAKGAPGSDPQVSHEARKRWHYRVTPAGALWTRARAGGTCARGWQYERFGAVAFACGLAGDNAGSSVPSTAYVFTQIWNAYERVRRPFGHTPFLSVALLAMLSALEDGQVLELARCHEAILGIKRDNSAPEHAFFASGNEIDKMFILLKPGFLDVALRI